MSAGSLTMTDAVIVGAARTPIGRAVKGSLADVDAFQLAEVAVSAAIERAGLPASDIDDLILAESLQGGGVIARYVALKLGLLRVPGLAVNRHCAASLSAIQLATATIRAGLGTVLVAGGTESLSSMPRVLKSVPASARDYQPWASPSHPETAAAPAWDMAVTVGENTARLAKVTRAEADEWALLSHTRAAASIAQGHFAPEIAPVKLNNGQIFDTDEHPRADTTAERLAALPVLHPELDGAVITAGNAAGLNDAAAAVVLASRSYARAAALVPIARIVSAATVGVEPERTGLSPVLAIPRALDQAGLKLTDIDLFEVNEAFAAVVLKFLRDLDVPAEKVNVNGGAIALGHPLGATGAMILGTLIDELERRDLRYGLATLCVGGGMGVATIVERI
jgi:acetyl-CoA C-acetyltransferase